MLSAVLGLAGCRGNVTDGNAVAGDLSRTSVTLTEAVYGSIPENVEFSATSAYLDKSEVASPVSSFVKESMVSPGTVVKAGDILYSLVSKEQHALGDEESPILIRAAGAGIVMETRQQAGTYAAEGSMLCSIADAGSLVFIIDVPYEQRRYVRAGAGCTLVLPDGLRLSAIVRSPLAVVNEVSQSERMIAVADAPSLPEGLNVRAVFAVPGSSAADDMILPKSAVQSDETLTEYWVMKMSEDSTAVKIPVELVRSNASDAEIRSAELSPQDKVILKGGYGLENGARVTVGTK